MKTPAERAALKKGDSKPIRDVLETHSKLAAKAGALVFAGVS